MRRAELADVVWVVWCLAGCVWGAGERWRAMPPRTAQPAGLVTLKRQRCILVTWSLTC